MYFGVTGDWHGVPDVDRLVRGVDIGFEDLLQETARPRVEVGIGATVV
jgi:hypothetical protein